MAFSIKMKPETIARRKKQRKIETEARRKDLRRRMQEKADSEGPESIWAEMLEEMDERIKEDKIGKFLIKQLEM